MGHARRSLSTMAATALVALLTAPLLEPGAVHSASIAASRDDVVVTRQGAVRGEVTNRIRRFLGIPYAAAPVGELRWRPPQPHPGWRGARDATRFGHHCAQPPSPFGQAGSIEDCLFLNVYTPVGGSRLRSGGASHPVMVWIHPGGGFAGASDDWNPTPLVEQGTVVVTFNYRLGALGFLAHPALTAESRDHGSGNYGLMDQQAALRWVRDNVARFGGDPRNVTLFGHSAGGYAVRAQLASPMAAGLFDKAIIQTGAWAFRPPQERSPGFPARVTDAPLAAAESRGTAFATAVGCVDQTAACLRGVPVEEVLANQSSVDVTVDGRVLTEPITAAFDRGAFNRVPVLAGVAHDEWRLFVAFDELVTGPLTTAGYPPAIAATLDVPPANVSSIVAQYPIDPDTGAGVALGAVGTDAALACPTVAEVHRLATWVPTFMYEFNDIDAPPPPFLPPISFPYGAFHGAELPYLFDAGPSGLLDTEQQHLARTMVRYWTNFAATGRPGAADTPRWPRYSPGTARHQTLTAPAPATATGFAVDHHCGFWTAIDP